MKIHAKEDSRWKIGEICSISAWGGNIYVWGGSFRLRRKSLRLRRRNIWKVGCSLFFRFRRKLLCLRRKNMRFLHKNAQKSHFSCYKSQKSLYSSATNISKHKRTVHFTDLPFLLRKSRDLTLLLKTLKNTKFLSLIH